jgi:hypothetical protein
MRDGDDRESGGTSGGIIQEPLDDLLPFCPEFLGLYSTGDRCVEAANDNVAPAPFNPTAA